jgi:hypothetical protein
VSRLVETVFPERLGRSFRWLAASSWTTNIGDGLMMAAGPLLVASQTWRRWFCAPDQVRA